MSDLAGHAAVISDLPSDIRLLGNIIQGLLVHSDRLAEYGLDETRLSLESRRTLSVADRIDNIFKRDPRPLQTPRPPETRAIGTCRDFALMLCSFLRSKGVPSRLRCGFAAYLGNGWEDHWVCEYWDGQAKKWRFGDPQIDDFFKDKFRIRFDPADIPSQSFMTAGQAWLECRADRADPIGFGHGNMVGLWFVEVNVVRDHYALNGREISAWDRWREAPLSKRVVHERDAEWLDRIAKQPDQQLIEVGPDWLV